MGHETKVGNAAVAAGQFRHLSDRCRPVAVVGERLVSGNQSWAKTGHQWSPCKDSVAVVPVGENHAPNSRSLPLCSHPYAHDLPGSMTSFRKLPTLPTRRPLEVARTSADRDLELALPTPTCLSNCNQKRHRSSKKRSPRWGRECTVTARERTLV